MKCEVCLSSLEEYLDGELSADEVEAISSHLVACSSCSEELASLRAAEDLFSQYDRQIEISPTLWQQVSERALPQETVEVASRVSFFAPFYAFFARPKFSLATAVVLILFAVTVGTLYVKTKKNAPVKEITETRGPSPTPTSNGEGRAQIDDVHAVVNQPGPVRKQDLVHKIRRPKPNVIDHSDVLSADFGYQDLEDEDTIKHIEQSQNLLRSIRNVRVSDADDEIDVTYDKALSRRLLNENIVLRRDAEMRAKFPTKALLSDLEPILIDIANLPDQAKPEDVRVIKERVQKTEIVAELLSAGLR